MKAFVSRILEIRWRLFLWLLQLNRSNSLEALTPEQKVQSRHDLEWSLKELDLGRGERWLRYQLQHHPYWRRGHIHFAEIMLVRGDVPAAYGSALAARSLAGGKIDFEVGYLLGRCYLRSGDAASAIKLLELAQRESPIDWAVHEELAAGYLALGNREQALATLERIPTEKLNQSSHAAMAALRAKL